MGLKYGIYQATTKSCVFYKQDDDGNQSTFNVFVTKSKEEYNKKDLFAFIDNEQMSQDNWTSTKEAEIKDLLDAFGGWATDAPVVFELEAQKSLSQCLSSMLKEEDE
jgi:hypothetical protein